MTERIDQYDIYSYACTTCAFIIQFAKNPQESMQVTCPVCGNTVQIKKWIELDIHND